MFEYKIINYLGVSETKINKKTNTDYLSLTEFSFHIVNSITNSGGVGIYTKNSIIY